MRSYTLFGLGIALCCHGAIVAMSAEARFSGSIRDPSNRPVPHAKVSINRVTNARISGDKAAAFAPASTDGSGRFQLSLQFESAKPEVGCQLRAELPGYVITNLDLTIPPEDGSYDQLEITLRPGLILSGQVERYPFTARQLANSPSLGQMRLPVTVKGSHLEDTFVTDETGYFEIYVPAGDYQLTSYIGVKKVELTGVAAGTTNLFLGLTKFDWSPESIGRAFDEFWGDMDRKYPYFFLKKDMNWAVLREKFRPQAMTARNTAELGKIVQEMLATLRDLHIWIETPDEFLPTHRGDYIYNGNREAVRRELKNVIECGEFAVVARTKADGFGYFQMVRQSRANPESVDQAIAALEDLRDVPGYVIDLRLANGGSEPLAQRIAQLFCSESVIYAGSKYRNGPGHNEFGPEGWRTLEAAARPIRKPVVCLIGPGAVSSGEGFVLMMKALPHVTTVGMPTRGASGNPKPYLLDGTGVTVTYSRWVSLQPDGQPFEGVGIQPGHRVDESAEAYTDRDPTLEKGLELLRERIGAVGSP